jgi:hypothetical protein
MRILPFFLSCFSFLIFSLQTVYVICYIDLLCAGSTHLHGIRVDEFLEKRHTIFFLQVLKIEDSGKMEFPKESILTPYNLFSWKENMIVHIQGRGLYRLTMDTETKPTSSIEKYKYLNQMDEVFGTICSLISHEILFHISSCKNTQ